MSDDSQESPEGAPHINSKNESSKTSGPPSLSRRPSIGAHRSTNPSLQDFNTAHSTMNNSDTSEIPSPNVSSIEINGSQKDPHSSSNTDSSDDEQEEVDKTTCNNQKPMEAVPYRKLMELGIENRFNLSIIVVFIFIGVFVSAYYPAAKVQHLKSLYDIKDLKWKFSSQKESFWLAFDSGVNDVLVLNRPSTFVLLYKEDTTALMHKLLVEMGKYATCHITHCLKDPIYLSYKELQFKENVEDYGNLFKYRPKLKDKGVMIVTHLERVPGLSAQVFHSFCDEYTPAVPKSLFIFTVKVEEFHKNNMQFLENFFKEKWSDLKGDVFHALFTRITGMVLEVMPP